MARPSPNAPAADDALADERVGVLRGAGAPEFDARRLGSAIAGVLLAGLLAAAVVLFAVGAHENSQIDSLRDHGVPVEVTVTGCLGLMGGSGSNLAGYACTGTYTLDGRLQRESIPGNTAYKRGAVIRAVAVPSDPGLVAPVAVLVGERSSATVFIVPSVLLAGVVAAGATLAFRRRRRGRGSRRQAVGVRAG